jgi:hypothetical protein
MWQATFLTIKRPTDFDALRGHIFDMSADQRSIFPCRNLILAAEGGIRKPVWF